jgi:hypothetical protein
MEQSPFREANSPPASQEIRRILRNMKVHYRVKSPPLIPVLNQMHAVHIFSPYFPNIHSNIILPSTPRSSESTFPFRFPNQNTVCIFHLSHACYPRTSVSNKSYISEWIYDVCKLIALRLIRSNRSLEKVKFHIRASGDVYSGGCVILKYGDVSHRPKFAVRPLMGRITLLLRLLYTQRSAESRKCDM